MNQKTNLWIPLKEQASNSSDEPCEEDEEEEEDEDSYYDEDGQLPAAMVMSTEKPTAQSTISNNGSGATLSIRNAKSVSKKSKPAMNVRPVNIFFCVFFSTWIVALGFASILMIRRKDELWFFSSLYCFVQQFCLLFAEHFLFGLDCFWFCNEIYVAHFVVD